MLWHVPHVRLIIAALVGIMSASSIASAAESRFAKTHSRSQYVHWIDLYDAEAKQIDPSDPNAAPYSPVYTCGKCHDYQTISHGFHFNAVDPTVEAGMPGEPWIWTDTRTGTRIPLSYRGWSGTYHPDDLDISPWDFVLKFGRHMPGGGPGEGHAVTTDEGTGRTTVADDEEEEEVPARWHLSGQLGVDCLFCHSRDQAFSPEKWWEQIEKQNFAWASSAAAGIATIDGAVSRLPDDFDPEEAAEDESGPSLPQTIYASLRMNADKQIFFDVTRRPSNDACYYCHTARAVGRESEEWNHDQDVHLQAGMSCVDCHRNGIGHHIVRGFEGEQHPDGAPVGTLSCRGCHMGEGSGERELAGGRLGAPQPLHEGLPPLHFERMSCTACHSGPRLGPEAMRIQLSRTHALGLPTHHLTEETPPGVVGPVLLDHEGTLYPHRVAWPAFWGVLADDTITPINPEAVNDAIRRIFRVRRTSTFVETLADVRPSNEEKEEVLGPDRANVPESEWTDEEQQEMAELVKQKSIEEFQEKLAEALEALQEKAIEREDAQAVFVSTGRAYRLADDGSVEAFSHPATEPYAWRIGHDVRPARWSAGVTGCYECHALDVPLVDGEVTAIGPAPEESPVTRKMHEFAGLDETKMDAWALSFQGRTAFKWFGFFASGVVCLVLLSAAVRGTSGLARMIFRK